MTLNILFGRWWTIVCPPSRELHNVQKGCINGAVHTLLPALTNPQGFTRLHVVSLVTQDPSGLPVLFQRLGIKLVLLCYV